MPLDIGSHFKTFLMTNFKKYDSLEGHVGANSETLDAHEFNLAYQDFLKPFGIDKTTKPLTFNDTFKNLTSLSGGFKALGQNELTEKGIQKESFAQKAQALFSVHAKSKFGKIQRYKEDLNTFSHLLPDYPKAKEAELIELAQKINVTVKTEKNVQKSLMTALSQNNRTGDSNQTNLEAQKRFFKLLVASHMIEVSKNDETLRQYWGNDNGLDVRVGDFPSKGKQHVAAITKDGTILDIDSNYINAKGVTQGAIFHELLHPLLRNPSFQNEHKADLQALEQGFEAKNPEEAHSIFEKFKTDGQILLEKKKSGTFSKEEALQYVALSRKVKKTEANFPSHYATTNFREYLCECFKVYKIDPNKLKPIDSKAYQFFQKVFG